MRRVAALCLPDWSIDRLRRAGAIAAPPERGIAADGDALAEAVAAERANECSVPNTPGWRPGARWARGCADAVEAQIAALPLHQRPPMRELGRRSEAADHPFRALRPDEARGAVPFSLKTPSPVPSTPAGTCLQSGSSAVNGKRIEAHPKPPASQGRSGANAGKADAASRQAAPTLANDTPTVTSLRNGSRVVIHAACPLAQAAGLKRGMALTAARAMVPGLAVHPADPDGDARGLRRLAVALARKWSPGVAIGGEDLIFIELTGVAHLFGGEAAMAARIAAVLRRAGHHACIAVAGTPGAAAALVRHAPIAAHPRFAAPRPRHAGLRQAPDMRIRHPRDDGNPYAPRLGMPAPDKGRDRTPIAAVCPPGAEAEWLGPLPVTALRLDDADGEMLRRFGIETIGQLAALPRAPLARRFTRALERLDQALGHVAEPLDPVVPRAPIACRQGFLEPIATAEGIAHWLGELVPRLVAELAAAGLGARAIELVAERVDHVPQRLRIGLARASRDPVHILRLIARRIETIEPGYGIDAMTLHVRRAEPLGPAPFDERLDAETAPDLAPLVDAIANRIGMARLWRTRAVESDVPERSVAPVPPLVPPPAPAARLRADDVRRLDGDTPPVWHPAWPRPARLLRRPERLDHVVAELPDRPPARFTWRGVSHRVVRADGPERIHGEWWRRLEEGQAVRDYFRVEDEAGRRYWLYRRGDGMRSVSGDLSWWLHGLFG
jgi:protein ImuB